MSRESNHMIQHVTSVGRCRTCVEAVGCGRCGKPLFGQNGYTGDAAYHFGCAKEIYGDDFRDFTTDPHAAHLAAQRPTPAPTEES